MQLVCRRPSLMDILAFMVLFCLFPCMSLAIESDITSKTYLRYYEDARDNRFEPFYEYVEIDINNIKEGELSFHSAGWLRYDLRSTTLKERERDELTYAYLRYAPFKDRRLLIDAGRQYVFSGISLAQLDGVSMRWDITTKTGFALYGGMPVETEFDGKGGDLIYGGRVFQRLADKAEVGLSFVRKDNDDTRFREEFGLDIWLHPLKWAELQGQSSYNNIARGWMDHSYRLRIFPLDKMTLSGIFSHTSYDLAFAATTLSAFSPDFLKPDEELTKKGGSIEYRFSRTVRATADFINYEYKKTGAANYYGATVSAKPYGIAAGLSFHRMEGDTEKLRYTESRFYAAKVLEKVKISMDAINIHYNSPFSGLSNAYLINGTMRYTFKNYLSAALSLDYSKSPDLTQDTKLLLNLRYNFRKKT